MEETKKKSFGRILLEVLVGISGFIALLLLFLESADMIASINWLADLGMCGFMLGLAVLNRKEAKGPAVVFLIISVIYALKTIFALIH